MSNKIHQDVWPRAWQNGQRHQLASGTCTKHLRDGTCGVRWNVVGHQQFAWTRFPYLHLDPGWLVPRVVCAQVISWALSWGETNVRSLGYPSGTWLGRELVICSSNSYMSACWFFWSLVGSVAWHGSRQRIAHARLDVSWGVWQSEGTTSFCGQWRRQMAVAPSSQCLHSSRVSLMASSSMFPTL